MSGLDTTCVTQIGILVNDIEKVRQAYSEIFQIEEPEIIETGPIEEAETNYRGKPSEARSKLCFFNFGQVQIELIQPDQHPSTWREYLDEHGEGVHHIAFVINGMKEKVMYLEGKGIPLVQEGEYDGGRYSYMDSTDNLKVLLELLENDEVS
ncbi:lactoylglutathione lyase [Halolactibacillus miurensis]|uniref:Glyoxalase/Bleomycin resistance protein/Dioxygenase superfamily protein n=1 Tax=Halolactibacillus miurensis TaxID=306541 RepID=A0A1I6UAY2_9BACI|nr:MULTISPECIES: VOC family protein [Halolactibacillus]GEM05527.1 lactoylglutathione lyase [Halolactibacillus miurensis]SFS98554.1 Glyoxalase/Bleomycin resistance protein/Dioxygenase superfamily protein [Halolactibacillus miurensis]